MQAIALDIIRDEHLAISAVLYALRHTTKQIRTRADTGVDTAGSADFALLHAILDYIAAYPDHWHHPKEDDFLFAVLRGKSEEGDRLIALASQEHADGYPMIGAMKRLLADFESGAAAAPFLDAADDYVKFEWAHMRREEDRLLPLSQALLTPAEWAGIDEAFRANENPLSGLRPKDEAEELYRRILELAPGRPR